MYWVTEAKQIVPPESENELFTNGAEFLSMKPKIPAKGIKTIDVNAKEWFDRVNGNSYFSATVTINFGMRSEKTIKIPFSYGYGDQYIETAGALFDKPDNEVFWRWCKDNNIILRSSKQKGMRKRDLKD